MLHTSKIFHNDQLEKGIHCIYLHYLTVNYSETVNDCWPFLQTLISSLYNSMGKTHKLDKVNVFVH